MTVTADHRRRAGESHVDQPTTRLAMRELIPDAYKRITAVESYVRSNLDHTIYELVKLRASMLNGCSYCVDMHSKDALEAGETTERLFAVAAWHEAPFFSRRERAALALTDAVTRLGPGGVSDDVWEDVSAEFTDVELANLLVGIAMINLWNRLSVPVRNLPPAR